MGNCAEHRSEGEECIGCNPEELYSAVISTKVWLLSIDTGTAHNMTS